MVADGDPKLASTRDGVVMAGSAEEWARYERWNGAIAVVVYTPAMAGQPVYLDLEDEVIKVVRQVAEPEASDPTSALIDAVKGTLLLRYGAGSVFASHLRKLDGWYDGSMLDPPPSLGLLAMLSLVAENMRQSDDMRAHNYYGRLAELVGLDHEQLRWFEIAYRHRRHKEAASAELWGSLNHWLEMMEGSRGLPTAYPLGHDHVGLPLSQALVRQADRDKFSELFVSQGLPAGSSLPASEMSAQIDEWMSRIPCPASNTLEHLWKEHPAAREPIAEVACLTLEAWNGVVPEGLLRQVTQREIDAVRLKVVVRTFPSRRIDFSMVVPGRVAIDAEKVDVLDANDETIETIEMVPCASGWLGVGENAAIDAGSFLDGQVRLRIENEVVPLRRRPRRLVPLRWDDLLQGYVECERVQLGEDILVLSRREIAPRVAAFLDRVARPGYGQPADLPGLPDGWTLFDGVQILVSGQRDPLLDLGVLQPLALSQFVLQGGLKLPGHLRKWLSARPPELRVSSDEGSELTADLTCVRPLTNPIPADITHDGAGAILIWDLSSEDLPDGDYQIDIQSDGDLIGSELLRLRSSDSPALRLPDGNEPIVHDPMSPGFGFFATRSWSSAAFEGAPDASGVLTTDEPPSVPKWWTARATQAKYVGGVGLIRFPKDGPSCIETGGHHMALPIGLGQTSIEGICRYCGLVKRYSTRYHARKKKQAATTPTAPAVRLSELPSVRSEGDIDWSIAFDALCHVGSGSFSALDRITSQMEATDLFGDAFARRLEVLGHIELERNPRTLTGVSWQVNNPVVIGLSSDDVAIIGFRNERELVAIEDEVWSAGGEFIRTELSSGPPIFQVAGLDHEGVLRLTKSIGVATDRPTRFIPDAALRLASLLPTLSQARRGLPASYTVSARSYELWDPITARFVSTTDAAAPGAFRLNGHARTYVYRRSEDLGAMRGVLGDARIVKYLAALDSGLSLVGYDPDFQVLYVPLGADLPGLYGRAAVLASGRPPLENTEERILEYRKVPPQLAAHLAHLLMS
jgi:hypothetical protein